MFPSIVTFDFYSISGSIFDFYELQWAIFEVGVGFANCLGCTHVVEQLLFSMYPSILTFDFDLILGSFLYFLGP